jgi:6,7-dimethyl-8-ribityllumazine synthase
VGFGLLTVDTVRQAMDRSGESGNKGGEAAAAALG